MDVHALLNYLEDLERLSMFTWLTSLGVKSRRRRYEAAIAELNSWFDGCDAYIWLLTSSAAPPPTLKALKLTSNEREVFLTALSGKLYPQTNGNLLAGAILHRLNDYVTAKERLDVMLEEDKVPTYEIAEEYDLTYRLTVEHIMPQNLPKNDDWSHISFEEHEHFVHSVGNLALIPIQVNNQSQNRGYCIKKILNKDWVCDLPLSKRKWHQEQWGAIEMERELEYMLELSIVCWKLY